MIDGKILRDQLAKPGLIPWIKSYFDELEKDFKMLQTRVKNMAFIDISNIDDFKKSIEEYQKEHPNAKVYATAFVYNSNEEPKIREECICCPTPCCEQEVIEKPKKKSKARKK